MARPRWLRPRFSLRAMFALMAIVAIWLGWQVHVVQQRNAFLKMVVEHGGSYYLEIPFGPPASDLPWLRRMMGDRIPLIIDTTTQADEARAKELFPECEIIRFHDPAEPPR